MANELDVTKQMENVINYICYGIGNCEFSFYCDSKYGCSGAIYKSGNCMVFHDVRFRQDAGIERINEAKKEVLQRILSMVFRLAFSSVENQKQYFEWIQSKK